jgi:hypothetical protein
MIYTVTFNPAIDYVVRLDAPLEVGAVNRAQGEDCVLGGKGINVSGVLAQLGCESVALGFVAGETGAWLERGLAAQGLKTDFVHLENGMTRINVKIKAGQETELNGAGPAIPESALQQLEAQLDKLAEIWQTNKKTPAIVEFVDIAGLVKGASQGAGLGNKFLGHIRECDAIVHVVRCFDDDNIIHVVEDVTKAEAVDPIADIDAIDYELILSDLEVVQNRAGRMAKAAKSGNNKGAAAEAAWLQARPQLRF